MQKKWRNEEEWGKDPDSVHKSMSDMQSRKYIPYKKNPTNEYKEKHTLSLRSRHMELWTLYPDPIFIFYSFYLLLHISDKGTVAVLSGPLCCHLVKYLNFPGPHSVCKMWATSSATMSSCQIDSVLSNRKKKKWCWNICWNNPTVFCHYMVFMFLLEGAVIKMHNIWKSLLKSHGLHSVGE